MSEIGEVNGVAMAVGIIAAVVVLGVPLVGALVNAVDRWFAWMLRDG